MRSVFLIVYMKLFLWNPLLLFTGDILQGVLLRTEWTVTSNNLFAQMNNIVVRKEGRQEGGNVWVWQLGYFWEQYFCFG